MELHYTLDKKSYRRMIETLARTKGSALWQKMRAYDQKMLVLIGTIFVLSMFSAWMKGRAPNGTTAIVFVLLVLLGVLACWFLPKVEAMEQTNTLSKRVQEISDTPCLLRLQDGMVHYEGFDIGPLNSGMTRPAASLCTVRVVPFGLVLVFRDGVGLAIPASAFHPGQPIQLWKQALEQAMTALPADAPEADWLEGFFRDEEGNLILEQQMDRNQARSAYESAFFVAVVFMGTYWKRNWIAGLLLGGAMLCLLALSATTRIFAIVLLLGAVAYKRLSLWKTADQQVGRTAWVFTPDALVRIMPDGTRMRLPYTEPVRLLAPPNAIGLYWPKGNAIWCVTREVISPSKAEALITLLRQRFSIEA